MTVVEDCRKSGTGYTNRVARLSYHAHGMCVESRASHTLLLVRALRNLASLGIVPDDFSCLVSRSHRSQAPRVYRHNPIAYCMVPRGANAHSYDHPSAVPVFPKPCSSVSPMEVNGWLDRRPRTGRRPVPRILVSHAHRSTPHSSMVRRSCAMSSQLRTHLRMPPCERKSP